MTNPRRLVLALLLGVAVYGTFVVVSGLEQIRESLGHFRWGAFAIALSLASLNYVLRFGRWQYYLARLDVDGVRAYDSALIFLSGFMLTVTPGKVGEVFKSAVLKQTHGIPLSRTAPIVVAERLTDVLGVVALILIGSSTFGGGLTWAIAGGAFVSLGIGLIVWDRPATRLLAWLDTTRLAPRVPKLQQAYLSLRRLGDARSLVVASSISVLGWGLEGVALHVLLRGFGCDVTVVHALFFYATSTLAGALVPVPGGLGVTEAIMHEQMVRIGGLDVGDATGSMILIRFATLWWAVVVGFSAFALVRRRHTQRLSLSRVDTDAANG